ncbi:MAG: alpha/beta hydrolase [Bacteroidetes bacterium]|nr:alpha/beta hydrolase [Bacteroidota bacterium]
MIRSVLAALLGLVVCLNTQAQTFLTYKNVAYDTISGVDEGLLSMDVYVPKGGRIELPVVMFVHGGGWQGGDRSKVDSLAKAFTDSAWVFVSLNYRLAPACPPCDPTSPSAVRAPLQARDVAKAIAAVKARIGRYNGDGRRICLLGDEAGGHLALLVCTNGEFLQAVGVDASTVRALCSTGSPLYDVSRTIESTTGDERSLYVNAFGSDLAEQRRASPIDHLTEGHRYPPMLCYSGDAAALRGRLAAFADSCAAHERAIITDVIPNIDSIRVFFRAAVPLAPLSVQDDVTALLTVRPNPAHDVITIDGVVANSTITVLDVLGRALGSMEHVDGSVQFLLPRGLPSSVVFVRYEHKARVVVQPVMIE